MSEPLPDEDLDSCYGIEHASMTRMRLFNPDCQLLWDSTVDETPAYQHISTSRVLGLIEYPDSLWTGAFFRCAEGVRRYDSDLSYFKRLIDRERTRP